MKRNSKFIRKKNYYIGPTTIQASITVEKLVSKFKQINKFTLTKEWEALQKNPEYTKDFNTFVQEKWEQKYQKHCNA
jgi:hypothetical protein